MKWAGSVILEWYLAGFDDPMVVSQHFLPMKISFTSRSFGFSSGVGALVFLGLSLVSLPVDVHSADSTKFVVDKSHEYFPDHVGNEWVYQGTMIEGGMVQIKDEDTGFTNVSTVTGKEILEGVEVTVFHDTNPGNQGPSDSYYRRDAAGIRYYGSKPGTTLERQLVPYQIVRFPLESPSTFEQFQRKGVDFGMDVDRDGEQETVDITATVSVQGQETVVVPAGMYHEAIRLEAKMIMQVHLSESGKSIQGTDTMTAWFARGVGLLKYIERQTIPSLQNQNERMVEVIEELEKVTLASDVALLRRSETTAKRVFRNNLFHHELLKISASSRLPADS
ncbi:MAG TPA: hypothetical protein PKK23_09980 [Nitrospirales bacterium]|nr:hypothetical protein [Nitrospirales bacterium]